MPSDHITFLLYAVLAVHSLWITLCTTFEQPSPLWITFALSFPGPFFLHIRPQVIHSLSKLLSRELSTPFFIVFKRLFIVTHRLIHPPTYDYFYINIFIILDNCLKNSSLQPPAKPTGLSEIQKVIKRGNIVCFQRFWRLFLWMGLSKERFWAPKAAFSGALCGQNGPQNAFSGARLSTRGV